MLAGALSGVAAAVAWAPAGNRPPVLVERVVHAMPPDACRDTLERLAERWTGDERVPWVWVDETPPGGVPGGSPHHRAATEAPRPYAFRPGAAGRPAGACSFAANSVHVLSVAGIAAPGNPLYALALPAFRQP